jgi:integral membrane protein (TIGR01906 family)
MKGEAPDLIIEAGVAGERREFFNQREKDHMVDVKNLILGGFMIRNAAAAVIAASLIILSLLRVRFVKYFMQAVKFVFAGFIIAASALTAIIVSDFDRAFTVFHQLFFNNDLWILNPDNDLLVNIVPLGFFTDISALVGVIFGGLCLAAIIVSIVYNRIVYNRIDSD